MRAPAFSEPDLTADWLHQKMTYSSNGRRPALEQSKAERQSDSLTESKPRHFSDRTA
ncbi:hypothetical protein K470107D9_10510 [Sutterella wadsworthensis]